ncbi:MAG: phosphopantetheine adenylyltransferase [Thermoplasmatota archaeon]
MTTTRERLITGLLVLVGLINLAPAVGVLSAKLLADAYGIPAPEGDLLILLRHRAILLGIIGGLTLAAARWRHLRPAAMACAGLSMGSFLLLALPPPGHGDALRGIVIADVIGLLFLAGAALAQREETKAPPEAPAAAAARR